MKQLANAKTTAQTIGRRRTAEAFMGKKQWRQAQPCNTAWPWDVCAAVPRITNHNSRPLTHCARHTHTHTEPLHGKAMAAYVSTGHNVQPLTQRWHCSAVEATASHYVRQSCNCVLLSPVRFGAAAQGRPCGHRPARWEIVTCTGTWKSNLWPVTDGMPHTTSLAARFPCSQGTSWLPVPVHVGGAVFRLSFQGPAIYGGHSSLL